MADTLSLKLLKIAGTCTNKGVKPRLCNLPEEYYFHQQSLMITH